MNRFFEFTVKDYVASIPNLLCDFTHRVIERCDLELSQSRLKDFERIVIVSDSIFCETGNVMRTYYHGLHSTPVDIINYAAFESYVSEHEKSFSKNLFIGIGPNHDTGSLFPILENIRHNGGFVVCLTDCHYVYAIKYADVVLSTSHPTKRSYLPILDYVIVILLLNSLGIYFSEPNEVDRRSKFNAFIHDAHQTASLITAALNKIENQITASVYEAACLDNLCVIGDGMDRSAALCCKYFVEHYLEKHCDFYEKFDCIHSRENMTTFAFTSRSNPNHHEICDLFRNGKMNKVYIVSDDNSFSTGGMNNSIVYPNTPESLKPILDIIVASLVVEKISERL